MHRSFNKSPTSFHMSPNKSNQTDSPTHQKLLPKSFRLFPRGAVNPEPPGAIFSTWHLSNHRTIRLGTSRWCGDSRNRGMILCFLRTRTLGGMMIEVIQTDSCNVLALDILRYLQISVFLSRYLDG